MRVFLFISFLFLSANIFAQQGERTSVRFNDNWEFKKEAETSWKAVSIPHTWNADDVMDEIPGYYRGVGLYRRKFNIDKNLRDKRLYLFFEGANQVTEVFINGKKAGGHTGGYGGFYIPVSPFLKNNQENELLVKVDNSHNQEIPPLSADFTFYGGMYRDVWLVALEPIHVSFDALGSKSFFTSTPVVDAQHAVVRSKVSVTNETTTSQQVQLSFVIKNKAGKVIASTSKDQTVRPGNNAFVELPDLTIKNPQLWSPQSPYLYTATATVTNTQTGAVIDVVQSTLGLRWFSFDAAKGFFLNGSPLKLVGTSRHQDYKGLGNAVPDELARKDMLLLKQMGGNFLRIAHYPQDPTVLDVCDSLGILTSVEIPLVNEITETDSFYHTCMTMQSEMIRQNFNHPSIIIWCSMNEILLRPHYKNDKPRQKIYYAAITKLATSLDSLTRAEDPGRYTMMAHHGDYNRYKEVGLIDIPMIVGWNLYSGWYGANIKDFPAFIDTFHVNHPSKPMLVSEYGADADPRIRSTNPVRFDKSVEYTTRFHQYYLSEMMKRPFVAAAMIWNLADFNSETRNESMPHINNKGLLEWDRTPKDPFYYYKAILSNESFVKILGARNVTGIADSSKTFCTRTIQVATNLSTAELSINDRKMGKQRPVNGLCEWKISFRDGLNQVEVKGDRAGKTYHDKTTIQFVLQPNLFTPQGSFHPMNILLGAKRYFIDADQQVWMPDQDYYAGSWGHTGGKPFKIQSNERLPYGTDKNIMGTNNDPIYQTQIIGIRKYQLDLPAGEYELTLHFAELLGGQVKELPYNLADDDRIEPNGKRIFNVSVNGKLLLDNFDITGQYGTATAVTKTTRVTVVNGKGVEIDFIPIEGEPVLNALQVKKVDGSQPLLNTYGD